MPKPDYPLRFEPILRRYPWGGRRLATVLGKSIGDACCAESWEICDRGADQTRVTAGPLAGAALHELVTEHGLELLGRHAPRPRFPLLLKFLDAADALSVQVHPDDRIAARAVPPDLGKSEAWVVLAAEPGSRIFAGLKPGIDAAALRSALADGSCLQCLASFEPIPGDAVFIPAGLVHALGAGLLVAEIQQSSDLTYRLYDWDRRGPDGSQRPLHVEEGLAAIDFQLPPSVPLAPRATDDPASQELVACEQFVLRRWRIDDRSLRLGGDQRCRLVAVVAGTAVVAGDPVAEPLGIGGTILLPAASGRVAIEPRSPCTLLEVYLP